MTLAGERYLVTGGAGFIGSHLCRRLFEEGAQVHVFDRMDAPPPILTEIWSDLAIHSIDITDEGSVKDVILRIRPSRIVHLAAFINPVRTRDVLHHAVNVNIKGTLNLLQALQHVEYASFLYVSTSDVYGNAEAPFREDLPLQPNSPHSFSKASAELLCRMLYQTYGQPATIIRPFLTFGPAQKTHMLIPSVIRAALAGERIVTTQGEQCREVNYVDDIVRGLLLASTSKEANGQTINLGSGVEKSVRDLVRSIVRLCSRDESIIDPSIPYRSNEIWHMCADNSKAKRILGWTPEVPHETALIKTIAWYREHPSFV